MTAQYSRPLARAGAAHVIPPIPDLGMLETARYFAESQPN